MTPDSPTSKKARPDKEKKVLVGVRVPESFHRRIQSECTRRDQTLQQLVVGALKIYFTAPLDSERMTVTFVPHDRKGDEAPGKVPDQKDAWVDIWLRYIHAMPPEKIEVLAKAMEWDLRAQKSSRRKSIRHTSPENWE